MYILYVLYVLVTIIFSVREAPAKWMTKFLILMVPLISIFDSAICQNFDDFKQFISSRKYRNIFMYIMHVF